MTFKAVNLKQNVGQKNFGFNKSFKSPHFFP